MKKTLLTLAVALSMGAALLTSCGADDTTGTTPEPTKTLVRANLYDTDWFSQANWALLMHSNQMGYITTQDLGSGLEMKIQTVWNIKLPLVMLLEYYILNMLQKQKWLV